MRVRTGWSGRSGGATGKRIRVAYTGGDATAVRVDGDENEGKEFGAEDDEDVAVAREECEVVDLLAEEIEAVSSLCRCG